MELTATEYAVIYQLAVHTPRVLVHSLLLQRVWGPERVGQSRLVRDVVKMLRRNLRIPRQSQIHLHRATDGIPYGGGRDT